MLKITKNAKTEKSQNHKNVQKHVSATSAARSFFSDFKKHLKKIHPPETPLKKTQFSLVEKNSKIS